MNDNINMGRSITGSMNDHSLYLLLAGYNPLGRECYSYDKKLLVILLTDLKSISHQHPNKL